MDQMTKEQKRIIEDSRKAMILLSMMSDDAALLLKSLEEENKKDAAVWAAFFAFDMGRSLLHNMRIGVSLTHLKTFFKKPDEYFAWQMEGVEQGLSIQMKNFESNWGR